jgi:hypothetical protein
MRATELQLKISTHYNQMTKETKTKESIKGSSINDVMIKGQGGGKGFYENNKQLEPK